MVAREGGMQNDDARQGDRLPTVPEQLIKGRAWSRVRAEPAIFPIPGTTQQVELRSPEDGSVLYRVILTWSDDGSEQVWTTTHVSKARVLLASLGV